MIQRRLWTWSWPCPGKGFNLYPVLRDNTFLPQWALERARALKGLSKWAGAHLQALPNNAMVWDVPSAWDPAVVMVFHHRLWQSHSWNWVLRHILWVFILQRLVISSHLQCTWGPILKVYFTWLHLLALRLSGRMAITSCSNFKKEVMIFQVIINKNSKQKGRAWITHWEKLPRQKIMYHK